MTNTPENLAKWIENPPSTEARRADAEPRHDATSSRKALAAYLLSLK